MNGSVNLGSALAPSFNYDTATNDERQAWLIAQVKPVKRALRWSLPSGGAPTQPSFRVKSVRPSVQRRALEIDIKVKGRYQIDRSQIPAVKQQLVERLCPDYAKSQVGQNDVKLVHTFLGKDNRRELQLVVSSKVCRTYM